MALTQHFNPYNICEQCITTNNLLLAKVVAREDELDQLRLLPHILVGVLRRNSDKVVHSHWRWELPGVRAVGRINKHSGVHQRLLVGKVDINPEECPA